MGVFCPLLSRDYEAKPLNFVLSCLSFLQRGILNISRSEKKDREMQIRRDNYTSSSSSSTGESGESETDRLLPGGGSEGVQTPDYKTIDT